MRKAAKQKLGDPNALEKNLVSMGHPNALQALMSGQIAGHVASAPFTYTEEKKGAHRVFGSGEVFDKPINNTLVAVREGVQEAPPEVTKALKGCIGKAIDTLNNDPNQAAELLEKAYQGKQSADSIKAELAQKDLVWPALSLACSWRGGPRGVSRAGLRERCGCGRHTGTKCLEIGLKRAATRYWLQQE